VSGGAVRARCITMEAEGERCRDMSLGCVIHPCCTSHNHKPVLAIKKSCGLRKKSGGGGGGGGVGGW